MRILNLLIILFLSCQSTPVRTSEGVEESIKKICLNFEGKTQIDMGEQKIVGSIESLVENDKWISGISIPLFGEEQLETLWEDNKVFIKGSMKNRLDSAFSLYQEKNRLEEDPDLILSFVRNLSLMIKHIKEFNNANCLKDSSTLKCGKNHWSLSDSLHLERRVNERFKILMNFSRSDEFYRRMKIKLMESKRPHLVQDILIRSCQ